MSFGRAFICAAVLLISVHASAADRPNLIVFLADDQRNTTLGCAGDLIAHTPVIDSLADRGVRFTKAFVTTPICAASRASILTGVTERTHDYTFGQPPIAEWLVQGSYPAMLRDAGYRTAFFGKFGVQIEGNPKDTMFDVFSNRDRPYHVIADDGRTAHIDELNTAEAIDFLKSSSSETPFCLSISFSSPHAEDKDLDDHFPSIDAVKHLHTDTEFPPPRLGTPEIFANQPAFLRESLNRERYFWRWDTPAKYQRNMRAYYRMLAGVDTLMGRVLNELEAQGLADNTVVIYLADNGYYMGDRGFAGKWSHYDESVRVPFIVFDPRQPKRRRGRTVDAFVLNLDLSATLLDFAGLDAPKHYQGRSVVPFLKRRAPRDWRTDFLAEHRWDRDDIPSWEGVRTHTHMYARYDRQNPPYEFLHDLEVDPDELINLAADPGYVELLEALRMRTQTYIDEYTLPAETR